MWWCGGGGGRPMGGGGPGRMPGGGGRLPGPNLDGSLRRQDQGARRSRLTYACEPSMLLDQASKHSSRAEAKGEGLNKTLSANQIRSSCRAHRGRGG